MKLKGIGIIGIVAGILTLVVGIVLGDTLEPDPWSDTNFIIEFIPVLVTIFGVLGILCGAIFLAIDFMPVKKVWGAVLSQNGNMITVEFEDGARKNLVAKNTIVAGDEGIFSLKANFVIAFRRTNHYRRY